MVKKHKATNGKMTMEKLASMSQHEFTAIRSEIKEGFGNVKGEMGAMKEDITIFREDMGIMHRDMEAGFDGVSEGMKAIMAKLNAIQEDVIEIHDLRSRVERLEKKVGLQK